MHARMCEHLGIGNTSLPQETLVFSAMREYAIAESIVRFLLCVARALCPPVAVPASRTLVHLRWSLCVKQRSTGSGQQHEQQSTCGGLLRALLLLSTCGGQLTINSPPGVVCCSRLLSQCPPGVVTIETVHR